ncbi:TfoX/Sxy family protein [Cellulomonas marina]|uniref:Transcriptional regulator of competence genes, TfoX/Sxy family n=1 Tax=Cellulomonas marina TaxID=988821 RepID=A0A1I0VY88_9CELL|nr:TfoX/Sxy family protein [Cellulomonas marina]GIG27474.1 hypothetical protein Cma02nite_00740 [Cellulomonas marina]SFA81254.1 Transcriptional regulator of competence genes, TfoX/Sxy family [Cellulomonas marina]
MAGGRGTGTSGSAPRDGLLARVDALTAHHEDRETKRMFGGTAVMLDGVMAVAVMRDGLLVRVDPSQGPGLLREPGVEPFVMGGQEGSPGWVRVLAEVLEDDDELEEWVDRGVARARVLGALPDAGTRARRRRAARS